MKPFDNLEPLLNDGLFAKGLILLSYTTDSKESHYEGNYTYGGVKVWNIGTKRLSEKAIFQNRSKLPYIKHNSKRVYLHEFKKFNHDTTPSKNLTKQMRRGFTRLKHITEERKIEVSFSDEYYRYHRTTHDKMCSTWNKRRHFFETDKFMLYDVKYSIVDNVMTLHYGRWYEK